MRHTVAIGLAALLLTSACAGGAKGGKTQESNTEKNTTEARPVSPFNPDSAYINIQKQVDFGVRVPNTASHRACADWLTETLKRHGLEVHTQELKLKAYDGTILNARNIIGIHNPDATRRVLLFAHWDTRPMADYDDDTEKRHLPIDGADDGGSGTGMLLEIARLLKEHPLDKLGIDIALFDAEDYGAPEHANYQGDTTKTWALGTQSWTKTPHKSGYRADFGILLDMVGARGARFYREYFSQEYAGKFTTLIWQTAHKLGYQEYFINDMGGAVTDDHYFVIRNTGIPCVDIINYDPTTSKGFGAYWHTHDDNMAIIDRATLKAVGETVWQVITEYNDAIK